MALRRKLTLKEKQQIVDIIKNNFEELDQDRDYDLLGGSSDISESDTWIKVNWLKDISKILFGSGVTNNENRVDTVKSSS